MGKAISLNIERTKSLSLDVPKTKGIGLSVGASSGSNNYEVLYNKPRINGVELVGNKLSADINVQSLMAEVTPQEIDTIIYGG